MANLTIAVDDQLLQSARVRAVQEGTSVNAVLRAALEGYVNPHRGLAAREAFVALAETASANSDGARWSRDELHDRAGLR